MHIRWTLFQNVWKTPPQPYQTSWEELSSYFSQHTLASHKESVALFSMNTYQEVGSRGNERGVYGGILLYKKKIGALDERIGNIISAFYSKKRTVWTSILYLSMAEEERLFSLDELKFFQSFSWSLFKKLIKFGKKDKSSALVLSSRPINFFKTKTYGHWPYLLEVHPERSTYALFHGSVNLKSQKSEDYRKSETSPRSCGAVNGLHQGWRDAL